MKPTYHPRPKNTENRSTFAVDKELAERIRQKAAESGCSVGYFVAEALRYVLENVDLSLGVEIKDKGKRKKGK